jgi:methionyl-tRNA formyltransferase
MINQTNIALFANHLPGLKVAEHLAKNKKYDHIGALYLTNETPKNDQLIIDALGISADKVFIGPDIIKQKNHLEWFKQQNFDFLISIYWPWLFSEELFNSVTDTINFHPALLPVNRGWFPHVHSIIDGTQTGVTLHRIAKGADTGDIWVQHEVPILITDTAKEIYDRLQNKIIELFKVNWQNIKFGNLIPFKQDESLAVYHNKRELDDLDCINLDQKYSGNQLINILRARTFANRGFAYFKVDGVKTYLKLSLSTDSNFAPIKGSKNKR